MEKSMKPNIIVIGAPRSGTYWMVDVLQRRFEIAFPSETHFIPIFEQFLWMYGDLRKVKNRSKLLIDIFTFIEMWTYNVSNSSEYRESIRENSLLESLFSKYETLKGSKAVGDKSAHYRAAPVCRTLETLPNAKAIHIVRDGRDVASSWLSQWFGPSKMSEAAKLWSEHVSAYASWGDENPDKYLLIKYEDMATDFDGVLDKLSNFLSMPITDKGETTSVAKALTYTKSHSGMIDLKAVNNIQKWKTMDLKERRKFEHISRSELKLFNYPCEELTKSSILNRKPNLFSKHQTLVSIKNMLPLALRFGSLIRIPIYKISLKNAKSPWGETFTPDA